MLEDVFAELGKRLADCLGALDDADDARRHRAGDVVGDIFPGFIIFGLEFFVDLRDLIGRLLRQFGRSVSDFLRKILAITGQTHLVGKDSVDRRAVRLHDVLFVLRCLLIRLLIEFGLVLVGFEVRLLLQIENLDPTLIRQNL